jgi:acyl-CoA thioester hydrolase
MYERRLRVRFSECDGLGHVNNGMYFTYMEDARTEIFELFNPSLNLPSWNLIVASARCDFLAQVTFAEWLTVHTWISRVGNSSFVLEHAIRNEQGEYVARGQATLIQYDYASKSTVQLSAPVREALSAHSAGPADAPELRG